MPSTIYALYYDKMLWDAKTDPGGPPTPQCPEAQRTGGLGPIFGFGTLWCSPWNWKDRLSQPWTESKTGETIAFKISAFGTMISADAAGVFGSTLEQSVGSALIRKDAQ